MKIRILATLSLTMLPDTSKGLVPEIEVANQYDRLEFEPSRLDS